MKTQIKEGNIYKNALANTSGIKEPEKLIDKRTFKSNLKKRLNVKETTPRRASAKNKVKLKKNLQTLFSKRNSHLQTLKYDKNLSLYQ